MGSKGKQGRQPTTSAPDSCPDAAKPYRDVSGGRPSNLPCAARTRSDHAYIKWYCILGPAWEIYMSVKHPNVAPINNPPKPRLVLRVGVTGHRTQPLINMGIQSSQLQQEMREVLDAIRRTVSHLQSRHAALFSNQAAEMRLISAVASGTDTIAVREALAVTPPYNVTAVMPFPAEVYSLDFTEKVDKRRRERDALRLDDPGRLAIEAQLIAAEADSTEFAAISMDANIARVTLDGERTNEDSREKAYWAAGQLVVNHSDILVAVWDNRSSSNRGGTWRVVGDALRLGIPIIHICPIGSKLVTNVLIGPDEFHRQKFDLDLFLQDEFARLLLPPDLWPIAKSRTEQADGVAESIHSQELRNSQQRESDRRVEYHSESYRKWIHGPFAPRPAERSLPNRVWANLQSFVIGVFTLPIGGVAKIVRGILSGQLMDRLTGTRTEAAKAATLAHPGTEWKPRLGRWWFRQSVVTGEFLNWLRDCMIVRDSWAEWNSEWTSGFEQAGGSPNVFESVRAVADREMRDHRCWAEMLAQYYTNLYRSAATLIYTLAALAVTAALAPAFLHFVAGFGEKQGPWIPHNVETFWLFAELILIVYISILLLGGRWGRWHERYIDYRLIAENLRILRYLHPLGRTAPLSRVPAHDHAGDPAGTWAMWHYRAVARAAGLVPHDYTVQSATSCAELWRDYVKRQEKYHREIVRWLKPMLRRLKRGEAFLLGGTILACVMHLFVHFAYPEESWTARTAASMTLLAALLPATGAALFAWLQFLDVETVEKREEAMTLRLAQIRMDFDKLLDDVRAGRLQLKRSVVCQLVDQAAQVMSDEAMDWRVQFSGQVLAPPP